LDFDKEILGDFYKGFEGVRYIADRDEFIRVLELIKNNKFAKRFEAEKKKQDPKKFMSFIELINSLVLKNYESRK
jgi:hypothetical protein